MIWPRSILVVGILCSISYSINSDQIAFISAIHKRPTALNNAAFESWTNLVQQWSQYCYVARLMEVVEITSQKLFYVQVLNVSCVFPSISLLNTDTLLVGAENISINLPISRMQSQMPFHTSEHVLTDLENLRFMLNSLLPQSTDWQLLSAQDSQSTFAPYEKDLLVNVTVETGKATLVWLRDTSNLISKFRRRHQLHFKMLELPGTMRSVIVFYDTFSPSANFSDGPYLPLCSVSTKFPCRSPYVLGSHSWEHPPSARRLGTGEPSKGLKVLCYNVWNVDSGPHWDLRLPEIARFIREESPDIVGLQEIRHEFADGLNQLTQLQELLPEYQHHFQPAQIERSQEEGLGIMSKYPILNITYALLPITQSADTTQRICLHATIDTGVMQLSFFVTHLAFVALPQLRQAGAVMKFMNEIRGTHHLPQCIVGDWNFYPDVPETHDYLVGHKVMQDPEYPRGDLTEAFQSENTWPTWGPFVNRPDRIYFRNSVSFCSLPGDEACWVQFDKLFAGETYRVGFSKDPGNRSAVASDHVAVITSLHNCGIGFTYGYDAALTVTRNGTTFGPLGGISGCVPACIKPCGANSSCVAPEECKCDMGFHVVNGECVLDCRCGAHGTCISATECVCYEGYSMNTSSNTCQPHCESCPGYAECTAPETCNCLSGYVLTNSTCEPLCPQCRPHSFCAAPNVCACEGGYDHDGIECIPVCDPGCSAGSTCIAPNVCHSERGLLTFLVVFGLICILLVVIQTFCCKAQPRYMPVADLELSQLS